MFESENGGMVMPVGPMYGNNGGFGNMGGDWAWIILLLLAFGGGWGNGFGGGFGGDGLYPWLNNSQNINGGFRDQMLNTQLNGIQNGITAGFGDVQNALCAGFAGVNAGIANGFAQAEISANARQIADMQQNFANQTATLQGFNGLQNQLSQCCCENRAGIADLKYTIAQEACNDRAAVQAGTQRILDQLCQDKIDAKNDEIAQLRSQVNALQLAESQGNQTAAIQAGQRALANEIEQYVLPTPRPAYIVQNPNCCTQNMGCGCGM